MILLSLVSFSRYYKFSFTFTGKPDGEDRVVVTTGSNSDDIYREEVNTSPVFVKDLDITYGVVYNGDNYKDIIDEFTGY